MLLITHGGYLLYMGRRRTPLEELEAIRDACPGPRAVTGDFNLILSEEDKNNDRIDRTNLRRFRRAVATLELQDLHLHGRCFTWSLIPGADHCKAEIVHMETK